MELTVRHFIPGRVRLHIPSLCRRPSLAEASLTWLRERDGITSARINYDCACLIVEYDVACEPLLRAVIGRLRLMSIVELRNLVTAAPRPTEAAVGRLDGSQSLLRRMPLALPTLSLALAFSANPIIRAINLPLMLWNAYPIALRAWRVWQREGRLNVDFLDTLAVAASLAQGNPLAGAIVTWLIKLGDWIRDLTAAGSRRAIRELLEFRSRPHGSPATPP
jgi:Cu2+-exporting ATPase